MYRICRMLLAILLAFAAQTTILPYFKMWGSVPDLLLCVLLSLAIHAGETSERTIPRIYAGLCLGLFASLILEATYRDAPGLTTVIHVVGALYAALMPAYLSKHLDLKAMGKKARKRLQSIIPSLLIAVGAMASEALHVAYTYLSGVDLTFFHLFRILYATVLAFGIGLIGHRLLAQWVDRPFQATGIGKWLNKRRSKGKPIKTSPTNASPNTSPNTLQ